MDLTHLQTGISGVLFLGEEGLNLENLYFLDTGHNCSIFKVVKNAVFLSVLICFQQFF